ncbi:unnamed protein product [Effrenium voratum]|nr:unnamed protein product [Effrenium voratum]
MALLRLLLLLVSADAGPGCVVGNCAKELARCLVDPVCRPWMLCTPRCKENDLACQIRCGDLYKPTDSSAAGIEAFSRCAISEHHCVKRQELSCQVPQGDFSQRLDLSTLTGTWYVTRGWNPLFDCFDCQVHEFALQQGEKPLAGYLRYAVKKDLKCGAPHCEYLPREVHQSFAQDPQKPRHLVNHNNSAEEMHYSDDWYVLAARPDVYALVYYCGCNDACCGYAGAVLYTRSPSFGDLLPEHQAEVRQAVLEAKVDGFEFEGLCKPDASACSTELLQA